MKRNTGFTKSRFPLKLKKQTRSDARIMTVRRIMFKGDKNN